MIQHTDASKLASIMERVQMLLARADHPTTPVAEAETARRRADKLMLQYKIDSLSAAPEAVSAMLPQWADIILGEYGSEWTAYYREIARYAANFTGCRSNTEWVEKLNHEEGRNQFYYVFSVVGFEGDIRYVEMLVTSAIQAFSELLEPKFNPKESHAANALRLRKGGMERRRIALVLFGEAKTVNEQKGFNRKVTHMIKEEAARLGTPELAEELLGRGNNIKTYRDSYAQGFYSTLVSRMRDLAHQRSLSGGDGALVLADYKVRIDEAFYERYEWARPKVNREDRLIGDPVEECGKCRSAKSGYCRAHSYMKPSTAKVRQRAYSHAGARAGSAAARRVTLGGPAGKLGA